MIFVATRAAVLLQKRVR